MLARQTHTKHRNRASIRSTGARVRTHHISQYVLGRTRLQSGDVHAQRSRPICQSRGRARPRERFTSATQTWNPGHDRRRRRRPLPLILDSLRHIYTIKPKRPPHLSVILQHRVPTINNRTYAHVLSLHVGLVHGRWQPTNAIRDHAIYLDCPPLPLYVLSTKSRLKSV